MAKSLKFNHKCPRCSGPIHVAHFSVKNVDIPIRENGWTAVVTPRQTEGMEGYWCPKCDCTVPGLWVYREMSQKEAEKLMYRWKPEKLEKKRGRKKAEESAES